MISITPELFCLLVFRFRDYTFFWAASSLIVKINVKSFSILDVRELIMLLKKFPISKQCLCPSPETEF